MQTTEEHLTPETALKPGATAQDGEYLYRQERPVRSLPVGTVFEDWYHKQLFEKVAEIITRRGHTVHVLQCLASPFEAGRKLGPVCSAFFCQPGDLVYREGSLRVFVP